MTSMPMMQVRGVSAQTPVCNDDDRRLDDLEERVDSLHHRMETILDAVEVQTRILEEIKQRGSIGRTPIPNRG
jgi:hypothetical protein